MVTLAHSALWLENYILTPKAPKIMRKENTWLIGPLEDPTLLHTFIYAGTNTAGTAFSHSSEGTNASHV